jgi:hypothetical protein
MTGTRQSHKSTDTAGNWRRAVYAKHWHLRKSAREPSFNAVNQMRVFGRWMRMPITIPEPVVEIAVPF